jgi:hypothetical protein
MTVFQRAASHFQARSNYRYTSKELLSYSNLTLSAYR